MIFSNGFCVPAAFVALAIVPSEASASGSATPPIETSFSANARCGFGEAEINYANSWNLQDGHQASIRSLQLKPSGSEPILFAKIPDQIAGKFFKQSEKIDRISTSCYENSSVIFNIFLSNLKTDAAGMAWQPGPTIHVEVGASGVSVSSSVNK